MSSAPSKRAEQLRRWEESDTNKQSPTPKAPSRIRFSSKIVFLAACAAEDKDEVTRLLNLGADINTANVDGLTALHQACIDDNLDMVEFLISKGADINRRDNEGWTPLHAVASCGFISIARYLLEHGASVGAVNYDGELPIDIADTKEMDAILQRAIIEQKVDCAASRNEELNSLKEDAKLWARQGYVEVYDPKTGATPLHVGAAKGYIDVLRLLLGECRLNPDPVDFEGWTPLHAAALWGQRDAAACLLDYGSNPLIRNYSGQTCLDLADPNLSSWLAEVIVKAENEQNKADLAKRTTEEEKRFETTPTAASTSKVSDALPPTQNPPSKGPEGKPPLARPPSPENSEKSASWRRSPSLRTRNDTKENEPDPPSPSKVNLRRTHSFENDKVFYQKYRDVTARIKASSCPSIPPLDDINQKKNVNQQEKTNNNEEEILLRKENDTNHISGTGNGAPTTVRSSPENAEVVVNNGTPETPNSQVQTPTKLSPGNIFKNFFKSFVPPVRDDESETQRKAHAKRVRETRRSTQGVTLDELKSAEQLAKKRSSVEPQVEPPKPLKKDKPIEKDAGQTAGRVEVTASTTLMMTAPAGERRPSWRLRVDPTNKFELEDVARAKVLATDTTDLTVTLPLRRSSASSTASSTVASPKEEKAEDRDSALNQASTQASTQAAMNVIQRRRRPKRRSTGVGHVDMDDIINDRGGSVDGELENDISQDTANDRGSVEGDTKNDIPQETVNDRGGSVEAELENEINQDAVNDRGGSVDGELENDYSQSGSERQLKSESQAAGGRDYKSLYESSSAEVRRLRELLASSQQQLRDARSTISRLSHVNQTSLSEQGKREKRAMERKLSEMEEELRNYQALQAENQRLKDENGALIRVISKLSK